MGFADNLSGSVPSSSSSGIFGMPNRRQDDEEDPMMLANRIRDRDIQDYQTKANFNSDLSLRQEQRMRNMFDPKLDLEKQKMGMEGQRLNVEAGFKNQQFLEDQKRGQEQSDLEKQKLGLEKSRIDSQNKFGQEKQDTLAAQEKLRETRNSQINEDRDSDRERKIAEANNKLALAQTALNDRTKSAADQLQAHKDYQAAVEERHKLEMEKKDAAFNELKTNHEALLKQREDELKQKGNTETTTELSPDGNKKTVVTKRGSDAINAPVKNPDGTYSVIGPGGVKGTIPANKLDDWMKNYHPGGGDE